MLDNDDCMRIADAAFERLGSAYDLNSEVIRYIARLSVDAAVTAISEYEEFISEKDSDD